MKTKTLHFNEKNTDIILFENYVNNKGTNNESRNRMKKLLSQAIDRGLTEKQKACIIGYYINGKKQKEIAKELGIDSSTVSRHITVAKKKLKDFVSIFEGFTNTAESA